MSKSGSIIVTGGAGLIGSAIVWALNQRGIEDILITDELGSGEKWKNLSPLRFQDYMDKDDFMARIESEPNHFGTIQKVFHLGANSSTQEKDAGKIMKQNFEYSKRLLQWSIGARARFIYASSAATYGDGTMGMDDQMEDIGDLRPLNVYGYSKQIFDTYVQRSGFTKGAIGLKYFNVFGPNEAHKGEMRSVVDKAYEQIAETGKVKLFKSYRPEYSNGEQMRDFLYVKDAAEMTIHLSDLPLAGGLYNLGSGVASTWLQLVGAIFGALGQSPRIEFVEMPEAMREKYQYYTLADITKLLDSGYEYPITPLTDSVYDYVSNYLLPDTRLGDEMHQE